MKIYRDFISNRPGEGIGSMEITLTGEELRAAYLEYQHELDVTDIMCVADSYDSDEEFQESYGITPEKLEKIAEKCAALYRRWMDQQDNDWFGTASNAIHTIVRKMGG